MKGKLRLTVAGPTRAGYLMGPQAEIEIPVLDSSWGAEYPSGRVFRVQIEGADGRLHWFEAEPEKFTPDPTPPMPPSGRFHGEPFSAKLSADTSPPRETFYQWLVNDASGGAIAHVGYPMYGSDNFPSYGKLANLFAAAPELLEACGGLLWLGNNLHNYGGSDFRAFLESAIEDARAAYEKATGEKQ